MKRTVQFVVCAFLCGIVTAAIFKNLEFLKLAFVVDGAVLAAVFVIFLSLVFRRHIFVSTVLFVFGAFVLGAARFVYSLPESGDTSLVGYYASFNTELVARGAVVQLPDERVDHTNLTVEIESVSLAGKAWQTPRVVSGSILAVVQKYPVFSYGDMVEIRGRLEQPKDTPDFSYSDYLSLFDVYGVMYRPVIRKVDNEFHGLVVFRWLGLVRSFLQYRINILFPEPHASLASGILFGARKGIPEDLFHGFQVTGIAHIVAISGYNITILIVFVSFALSALPKHLRIIFALLIISAFCIVAGASASVVRASLMGMLALCAMWVGRPVDIVHILIITAFGMALVNPATVVYDKGFQLSYAATFGLVFLSSDIETVLKKILPIKAITALLAPTLAAQIFTLPLLLNSFGSWSLIAPIANLLIVPLVPFSMAFSFAAVCLSIVSFSLGLLAAWWGWVIFIIIIKITNVLSLVPFASVPVPYFGWPAVAASYFLLAFVAWRLRRKDHVLPIS
ncbi:MAG: ComEC/Rec2 family competence protein [Patescibacteria group bacterium]